MNTHDFSLLRKRDIAACSDKALAALREWEGAWAVLPDKQVRCVAAADVAADSAGSSAAWQVRRLSSGGKIWAHLPVGFDRYIEQQVFGLNEGGSTAERYLSSPLAMAVVAEATEDLLATLINHLTGNVSTPDEAEESADLARQWRYGAGAALVTIMPDTKPLKLLLPADVLPADPSKPTMQSDRPDFSLMEALRDVPVRIAAEVGSTELSLGHLHTLAIGDVIPLSSRIDEPLRVTGEGRTSLCYCRIGTLDGRRAIELLGNEISQGIHDES